MRKRVAYKGNPERMIGVMVSVKVGNAFVPGRVKSFAKESGKYTVSCADEKTRRVQNIYVAQSISF